LNDTLLLLLESTPPGGLVQKTESNEESFENVQPYVQEEFPMNEDTILGNNLKGITPNDKMVQRINTALVNGDIKKASAVLSQTGLKDLGNIDRRNKLKAKYPVRKELTPDSQSQLSTDELEELLINIEEISFDKLKMISHIMGKKNGAAHSVNGFSMDHWKWVLEYSDEAGDLLLGLVHKLVNGSLDYGEARDKLLMGRGIPTAKPLDPLGVRPVTCLDPLLNTTGSLTDTEIKQDVREICGNEQLGGTISGGVEILVHTARGMLQLNPGMVLLTGDIENAYNSKGRTHTLEVIARRIPRIFPYAQFLLGDKSTVVYNCNKTGLTMPIDMECGFSQGDPISGSLFNISQAEAIQNVRERHPDVTILSLHDDHFIIGFPEEALEAWVTLTEELDNIGLSVKREKTKLFSFQDMNMACQEKAAIRNIEVINKSQGMRVAGSPVGTDIFESEFCVKAADEIIERLAKVRELVSSPVAFTHAQVHTAYTLIKLCFPQKLNHLLRTCKPTITREAATKLDEALRSFIFDITNSECYLPARNSTKMMDLIKRLHLKVANGGCGIISSHATSVGAYVGSIALCAEHMGILYSDLSCREKTYPQMIPMFQEHIECIEGLKCVHDMPLADLCISKIWDEKIPKVQQRINLVLNSVVEKELYKALPDGDARFGWNGDNEFSLNNKAIRLQGIANKDKVVSAFLNANPAHRPTQLNNDAFKYAFYERLLFNVMGSRKYCMCGMPMDSLGNHALLCPRMTIRTKLRNSAHAGLCVAIKSAFSECIRGSGLVILNGEPKASDYFEVKYNALKTSKNPDVRNPHTAQRRFDFAIKDHNGTLPTIVVDGTMICPLSSAIKRYNTAGDAAVFAQKTKIVKYMRNFHLENRLLGEPHFFAVETNGSIAPTSRKLCKRFAQISREPTDIAIQKIFQRISVSLHRIRAQQIKDTIFFYSMDTAPTCGHVSGEIKKPSPPAYYGGE
jgi:hypothetical protein